MAVWWSAQWPVGDSGELLPPLSQSVPPAVILCYSTTAPAHGGPCLQGLTPRTGLQGQNSSICFSPKRSPALNAARVMPHFSCQATDTRSDFLRALASLEEVVVCYPMVSEIGLCGNFKVLSLFVR